MSTHTDSKESTGVGSQLQAIRDLLDAWSAFYVNLPDGEYKGLGEMRASIRELRSYDERLVGGAR